MFHRLSSLSNFWYFDECLFSVKPSPNITLMMGWEVSLCFRWLHICMARSSWFLIEGQNVPLLLDCQHVVNAKLLIIIPAHNQAHTKQMGNYSHLLHSSLGAFSVIFPSSRTATHFILCSNYRLTIRCLSTALTNELFYLTLAAGYTVSQIIQASRKKQHRSMFARKTWALKSMMGKLENECWRKLGFLSPSCVQYVQELKGSDDHML